MFLTALCPATVFTVAAQAAPTLTYCSKCIVRSFNSLTVTEGILLSLAKQHLLVKSRTGFPLHTQHLAQPVVRPPQIT